MYTQLRNQRILIHCIHELLFDYIDFNRPNRYDKYTKIILCDDWGTRLHQKGFLFISWFIKINTAVTLVGVESHSHYFINFGHTVHACVS